MACKKGLFFHSWQLLYYCHDVKYYQCKKCGERKYKCIYQGYSGGHHGGPLIANYWLRGGEWRDPLEVIEEHLPHTRGSLG